MEDLCENSAARAGQGEKMTVSDLFERHEMPSLLPAGDQAGRPVSIIVLCGGDAPQIIGGTPHVAMDLEDDLLKKIRDLQEENTALRALSLRDTLTGLFNQRFFRAQLEIEMARTKRTGHNCSLMMIDLDNFKLINDTFGHLEGDRLLVEFSGVMKENTRPTDLIYRYGGDEFTIVMPATSAYDALKTGERFRRILMERPRRTSPGVSLSIGISEYTPYSTCDTNEFIHSADLAMYDAKKGGKNRICLDGRCEKKAVQESEVNQDERAFLLRDYE